MAIETDVIVVGSGITGGWAAKELAEAGLQTLLLEAGSDFALQEDAQQSTGSAVSPGANEQPIQGQCYACDGHFRNLFVSDKDHPYLSQGRSPFAWIRGRQLGGRSLAWARHCFRFAPFDLASAPGGAGLAWPLSYEELEPWYARVERWIGMSGQRDRLLQVPDSVCLPAFGLNAAEELVRERMLRQFRGERQLIVSRVATLPVAYNGRPAYQARPHQTHPVQDRAHFSSLSSTLPAALATGRLEIRTNSIVARVLFDSKRRLVSGVEVVDRITKQSHEARAPLVLLAAGALESTRLLLNSATSEFPDGLANGSGCLGRFLMDHLTGLGAMGELPELRRAGFAAGRPTTSYIARYRNVNRADSPFTGGYAFICDAFRPSEHGTAVFREQDAVRKTPAQDWMVRLWGFGECLPRRENRVRIAPTQRDAWGIPALSIDFDWCENELAMARDMATSAAEMLEAAGARNVRLLDTPLQPGLAIHEMGTARMGNDPTASVVNSFGQCHDIPNLYVVDGAILPTSPCQNPSLTYMALASRGACHAALQLRSGAFDRPKVAARLWLG